MSNTPYLDDNVRATVQRRIDDLFKELAPFGEAASLNLIITALCQRSCLPEYQNSTDFSVIKHPV